MSHKRGIKSGVKVYGPYGDIHHYPTSQGLGYIRRMIGWGWPLAGVGTENGIMVVHFPKPSKHWLGGVR